MLVLLKTLYKWLFLFSTVSAPCCGCGHSHLEQDVDGVGGEAAVLYCTVLYCTVLYCTVLTWSRMWMVSEVRQQSARSSTRTSGALGTVKEFRCPICLLHDTPPIFLVFLITKRMTLPSTFDIYFEVWLYLARRWERAW